VGAGEAIVMQQLHYHAADPNNGRAYDGEQWIYKSYEDWQKTDFRFWSTRTIRRLFRNLEEKKLVVSCQPEGSRNRRKYYRIDYEAFENFHARTHAGCGQNGRFEPAKVAASSYQRQLNIDNNSSAHAEFVRLWSDNYKKVLKESYVFQGAKDGRHVKTLLLSSGKTPAELVAVAVAAWKRPEGFWCRQAASISGFYSRFNEIRQEIKNGTGKRKESSRNIGTANEGKSSQYAGIGKAR
jgi:hypothetical protein